jgi:carboxypeptidase C (cathepsin A)
LDTFVITQHWVDKLETTYQAAFLNSTATPFISSNKTEAGYVRSAGHGAGNIAFMAIYEAGHMVSSSMTFFFPRCYVREVLIGVGVAI